MSGRGAALPSAPQALPTFHPRHPNPGAPLWPSPKGSALAFSVSDASPTPAPSRPEPRLHLSSHRPPPQVLQGDCPAPRPGLPGRGHRVHHLRRGGEASQQSVEDRLSPGVLAGRPQRPFLQFQCSRAKRPLPCPAHSVASVSSVVCVRPPRCLCVQLRPGVPLACGSVPTRPRACVPMFRVLCPVTRGARVAGGHVPARCLPPWAAGAVPRPTTAASGPQPGLTAFQGLRGPRFSRHWP